MVAYLGHPEWVHLYLLFQVRPSSQRFEINPFLGKQFSDSEVG